MQIQAVNNINFGQIYLVKGDYSDKQKNVINQIKKTLREPSEKFGNKTAEEFYKSENNLDFFMENSTMFPDAIYLKGCWGVKSVGTGVNRAVRYVESFTIGTYDESYPFKTDDIKSSYKEYRKKEWAPVIFAMNMVAIVAFGIVMSVLTKEPGKTQELTKPLIENVDSLANKAKSALPDTTKTLNLIK